MPERPLVVLIGGGTGVAKSTVATRLARARALLLVPLRQRGVPGHRRRGESFAPGSRQYRWIDATLRRSRACWKIPFFHQPVHAEYVNPSPGDVERHGVRLVLSGHEHNYVRSRQLAGVTFVLMRGGGAALDPLPPSPSPHAAARGSFFHPLLGSVTGRGMQVRAIDTAGCVRDRFRLTCGE